MKSMLRRNIPYLFYILHLLYLYNDFITTKLDKSTFIIDTFYSVHSMFFYTGIFIVINIYFFSIPFMEPLFYLRLREGKFIKLYSYYFIQVVKMALFLAFIIYITLFQSGYGFEFEFFITIILRTFVFVIFELLLYVLLYVFMKKEILSNLSVLLFNVLVLMVHSSYKFNFLVGQKSIDYIKEMDVLNLMLMVVIIIFAFIINTTLKKKEIL